MNTNHIGNEGDGANVSPTSRVERGGLSQLAEELSVALANASDFAERFAFQLRNAEFRPVPTSDPAEALKTAPDASPCSHGLTREHFTGDLHVVTHCLDCGTNIAVDGKPLETDDVEITTEAVREALNSAIEDGALGGLGIVVARIGADAGLEGGRISLMAEVDEVKRALFDEAKRDTINDLAIRFNAGRAVGMIGKLAAELIAQDKRFLQAQRPQSADDLKLIVRAWLDADCSKWGAFEKGLDAAIEERAGAYDDEARFRAANELRTRVGVGIGEGGLTASHDSPDGMAWVYPGMVDTVATVLGLQRACNNPAS